LSNAKLGRTLLSSIGVFSTCFSFLDFPGPPHVTGEMNPTYTAKIGDTVKIDCPIDSGPDLNTYYDWKKVSADSILTSF